MNQQILIKMLTFNNTKIKINQQVIQISFKKTNKMIQYNSKFKRSQRIMRLQKWSYNRNLKTL